MFNTFFSIALGFFGALFLVLLVTPTIARRISDLTWRQAERVLPQSMEEIAAARDKLRASFALDMRKLEMAHEALGDRHNRNRIDLVKVNDRAAALEESLAAAAVSLAEERTRAEELAAALSVAVQERDDERTKTADLSIRIESFTAELRRLSQESTSLSIAVERARNDAAEEQVRFRKMQEARDALRQRLDEAEKSVRQTRAELRAAESAGRQAARRIETLESKIAKLTADLATAEFKAAHRPANQPAAVRPAPARPAAASVAAAGVETRKAARRAANDLAPVAAKAAAQASAPADAALPAPVKADTVQAAPAGSELRRQMTAFRKVLPQAVDDEAARKRLVRPMTEIAAMAVADAVAAAEPGSTMARLADDPALAQSPLGQAIKRRLHKPRG